MERVVGIDGCRGGWAACTLTRAGAVSFAVHERIQGAIDARAAMTLIDMPIGLPERGVRDADMRAKALLGRWNARVFVTPARGVFACETYADANARSRELTGKGLSKQAWNIMPKVRELDSVLRADAAVRSCVRECHPEVCFASLAGAVIGARKTTSVGVEERLAVLEQHVPDAQAAVDVAAEELVGQDVAFDDLIDAFVCAVTAAGVWDGSVRTLPDDPPRDAHGLAMEMVYRDPG